MSIKNNIDKILAALNQEKNRRAELNNKFDWNKNARQEQKIPTGEWFGWFIMAGRGFGKTRTGAESVRQLVMNGHYKRICLISETYDEARSVMLEGESGLLNIHQENQRPKYYPSQRKLVWPNGAIATCYSAENSEALRGPQFDLAWIDEFAKFDNAQEVWDQLMFCLRLGKPKVIITSTPRSRKIIFDLLSRKDIIFTTGSTFNNKQNLSQQFLQMLESQYKNTQIGKQEIEGQLLNANENQLWRFEDFKYEIIPEEEIRSLEIIIAIDPAMETNVNSNETGIIVAGKNANNYYVIEDCSSITHPTIWAQIAYDLYKKYHAKKIIVETNQGGEILMAMLKNMFNAPWESIKAKESKYKRALPIASMYQQGKVIHVKQFEKLEEQMLNSHVNFANDRLDALVWAIFSLMQDQKDLRIFNCW